MELIIRPNLTLLSASFFVFFSSNSFSFEFDLRKLNVLLDNIEGLTFGPNLSQGDRSLILVSDNNFQTIQKTQILIYI